MSNEVISQDRTYEKILNGLTTIIEVGEIVSIIKYAIVNESETRPISEILNVMGYVTDEEWGKYFELLIEREVMLEIEELTKSIEERFRRVFKKD